MLQQPGEPLLLEAVRLPLLDELLLLEEPLLPDEPLVLEEPLLPDEPLVWEEPLLLDEPGIELLLDVDELLIELELDDEGH